MTYKRDMFIEEYLKDGNATRSAKAAGYSERTAYAAGSRLLKNVEVQAAIKARMKERGMSSDEVVMRLSDHARADLGVFFKIIEEWTFYPLSGCQVIDAKEVTDDTDPKNPRVRISYWVRQVVIDPEKLIDPRYSYLLHKYTNSPKNGIGIEVHNQQSALRTLAQIYGLLVERHELTGKDGGAIPIEVFGAALKRIYGVQDDDNKPSP